MSEAKPSAEAQPKAPEKDSDPFAPAADRIRETAKWLIATFGALGAALIASLQLSSLGETEGWGLFFAIVGFAVGLAGAVVSIYFVARVLGPSDAAAAWLEDSEVTSVLENRKDLLGGWDSLDELKTSYVKARERRIDRYRDLLNPYDQKAYETAYREYELARKEILLARPVIERLVSFVDLHRLQKRFETAMRAVLIGVVISAIGVAAFATSAASGEAEESAQAKTVVQPESVVLDFTEEGKELVGETLGENCDLDSVEAIVLNAGDTSYDVVVPADGGCELQRTAVPRTHATVTPPLPPDPDDL